jgi:hypothetical protein
VGAIYLAARNRHRRGSSGGSDDPLSWLVVKIMAAAIVLGLLWCGGYTLWYMWARPEVVDLIGKSVTIDKGLMHYDKWAIAVDVNSVGGFDNSLVQRAEPHPLKEGSWENCTLATRYMAVGILNGDIRSGNDSKQIATNLLLTDVKYYQYEDWYYLNRSHYRCYPNPNTQALPYQP